MLEVKNISVSYGNIEALKGVNISIIEGEIVCLIGANGAGKTTLLKSIMGLEPLKEGEIYYTGELIAAPRIERRSRMHSLGTDEIVSRGIALVPEGRGIFHEMTVSENLEMGAYLLKNRNELRRRMDEKYSMFEILRDRRKQIAGSLSGGEQQMLSLARALMSSPRLLLLDEPTLGLAPIIIRNIFNIISRINRENGVTVFLVEQNAGMALGVSNRGYVIETGDIVLEDTGYNLLNDPRVKAAYLGEENR